MIRLDLTREEFEKVQTVIPEACERAKLLGLFGRCYDEGLEGFGILLDGRQWAITPKGVPYRILRIPIQDIALVGKEDGQTVIFLQRDPGEEENN